MKVHIDIQVRADLQQNSELFPDVTIIGHFSPSPLFLFVCPLTFLQVTGITSESHLNENV